MPTTNFWNGIGNWSTSDANWSDGSPPDPTETAEIQTGTNNLTSAAAIAALQVDAPAILALTAGAVLTDTGSATVAGDFQLTSGGSASVTGDLGITGSGVVWLDAPFIGGAGGSNLAISGTLTNSSTNSNALYIGNTGIGTGDTVTAAALVNTGAIQITGNGAIQSTLNITTGAAGFGTLGVLTGSVGLTGNALLEFASGQIGTIDGGLALSGVNARIADTGTLGTNSALVGLNTVDGSLALSAGASVSTGGDLALTGNGAILVDSPFNNGGGGSTLAVGGTLTVSSTNSNALYIGNTFIGAGDTVTAAALVNTGVIQIAGNGTIQSVLDITTGAAGFGTVGVETGSVTLTNSLLEFASGQIGTIAGSVGLNGANALIADAGTLTTNSALAGLNTVSGQFALSAGASVSTSGGLSIVGNGDVLVDSPFNNGGGGSTLAVGGTLTNNSSNSNAFYIGNTFISTGDTVTAKALVNTGVIQIAGNGTIQSVLDITTGAAGFGTLGVETGSVTLTNSLLEFASGQIGTIAGFVGLNGASALIADAGKLTTNSALTGLNTVSGDFRLAAGASVITTGGLSIVGSGDVLVDAPFNNGGGGSSLNVGGTLTNSSTNPNAFYIGNTFISTGDTVTAKALVNSGVIQIAGNGTIQSVLNITTGAAGFGTVGVATGSVTLTNSLLEFASGQIGTIAGFVGLNGANARIADAGKLTTNSALTGLNTVSGDFRLAAGASVTTTGGLSIVGSGDVFVDAPFNNGGGGSSLTVGGTLTNSSSNSNAFYIGNAFISTGDTVTAGGLNNTGNIQIQGNGSVIGDLTVNGSATNSASVNIYASGDLQMGAGDTYTQAAGATNVNGGGALAGIVDVTGGAVNVVSGGTLAGTANVTGGSLDGTGTVTGAVNDLSGGTVFAGLNIGTPGTLTVSGDYNQSGTGNLEANIGGGGTTSGVVADTGGFVNLTGGTLSVSSTPALGQVLTVMTFGAGDLAGQFAAVQDGSSTGDGSFVNLGDGTSLEVFYNNGPGNIQIERVSNASLATSYKWTAATGNWSTAADWSGGQVPNPTANVVIGNTATGNVTLNNSSGDQTVNSLTILASNALTITGVTLTSATGISVAAGASLSLSSGEINGSVLSGAGLFQTVSGSAALAGDTISANTTFIGQDNTSTELLGAIDNAGTLEQIGGNAANGVLFIADAVTLTGGGTVLLNTIATNGGSAFIEGASSNQTLTNTDNTILGTGIIGNGNLALINGGVIDATPESGTNTLTLNGGGITNTGTMEATGGALLVIKPTVDNAGGTITADATSTVELSNSQVVGGTLQNAAGGTLETVGNSTLDGSTQGALTISAGSFITATDSSTTTLLGTIDNLGTLEQLGGNAGDGVLDVVGAVTLTGGGTVLLDTNVVNGGSAFILGNGGTLTNTNNTIVGTGVIGNSNLVVVNGGVIDATPEAGTSTLTLNGGGITNTKLLEATAGGFLSILTSVANKGANITATGSLSAVNISNSATITGGTLNAVSGGVMGSTGSATLSGVALSSGSLFTSGNSTGTTLVGTINNLGTIEQIGGNAQNGLLFINGAVTLAGGGKVLLDTIATNGGNAFIEGNGGTLTNSANTILGTGVIGNGNLVLVNHGVIDATPESGTVGLTLNGNGVTNTKLLEATAGGTLAIQTSVTNTGANITATGSQSVVTISNGAVITGGTLTAASGGAMGSTSAATLQGVTIAAKSLFTSANSTTTTLLGTIDNLGTIEQFGGNAQNALLVIGNAVTLTGGGTVLLDTIATNGGNAFIMGNSNTLTNTNNTIMGTGIIGNGNLVVVNSGVIDATPEGGSVGLTLNGGLITNTKLLEATAGGTLAIQTSVTNTGANITATGSQSVVTISNGAAITGGTLTTASGGAMGSTGSATLQGVTISAKSLFTSADNITTTLLGTIDNLGTIEQFGGNAQNAFLAIGNAVTLTGGGTVLLDTIATNGGNAFIVGNGNTLTNTNNTIVGTGIIGNGNLVVVNSGVIDATPESGSVGLTLNGGGVTNTKLLEATAGGDLAIQTNVTNTGGTIIATGSQSVVTVSNGAAISGGTLSTASGGAMGSTGSATLQGVTISAKSLFTSANGITTNLLGTIDNLGTIEQFGGNAQNAFLNIAAAVTLTGGGTLLLDTISTNGGDAFLVGNGNTLTNTNNTIMGTGIIGNGNIALINGGVIDAAPEGGSSTLTINTSGVFSSTGTLEATGGATLALNVGALTVSGLVSVAASSALDLTGELTVNGTLSNFGAVSGGGATEIAFGSGTTRLILGPDETFGGNVVGGGVNSTIELAAGADAGTLNSLGTTFTNFGTVIVDAGATWTVDAASSLLASTTFIGDGASSTLALTGAGAVNLKNVSNFGTIDLPAGNNTVTVTDKTLSGAAVTINDGASGNTTISAASDTSASKGKSLTFIAGTGTDHFTGGFENDTVDVAASSAGGDTLTGGSGTNTLVLTGAGSTNLSGVTKFPTIDLAATGITLTVRDALLSSGALTINDEASGNTVSAASDTAASKAKTLTYNAGSGTDSFTGGFENDKVNVSAAAVGSDTLTGGSGTNTLTLTSAGTFSLGGVSKFGTITLAAGNSTVTVTDKTLSGGTVTINDGSSGSNSITAAGDTSASTGKVIIFAAGTGKDSFTGGFENDTVRVSAAAVGGDTLTGGSGTNTLTLTSAGSVNLGGVSKFATINLAAGNSAVTVTAATLSGGTVTITDGASGNNTITAAGDTATSTGKTLVYNTGTGTDRFTGGFETDSVRVSATAVGADTLTGGSAANRLLLTSAGTFSLGGVSKFGTITLAAGNSTVTVTDKTLSGGAVTISDGASGNNSVSAVGDTAASKAKTFTYNAGPGTDSFTGGFESDVVNVSAAAVGGDTLTGGSGANTLTLTSAGSSNLGGVSKFATIKLAAGNSTVTVTDKTLSGGTVTISDGASGANTVSAASDTAASKAKTLTYNAGSGKDSFTGGFENDVVNVSAAAVGGDTLTGGSGTNTLTLTSAGSANLGGVSKFATIKLATGNSTVTVTDKTLSGGAVTINDGASGNNTVSAAGDTAASTGKTLIYAAGPGKDSFTGGFENDSVRVSAAAVGGDTLTGGSGTNTLTLTSAGSVNLGGVSKFATINLAAGNSGVTVTDKTLAGGTVTIIDSASGGNNILNAASDTAASTGKTLIYAPGTGADRFVGGFENDTVRVSSAAVGGDTLTGGSGTNTLTLTSAGSVNLGGVGKFATINLAAGNSTVTVTDKTLTASITLKDGASGNNSVSAAGDTTASKTKTLNYTTGSGTDSFTGGFENDAVRVSAAAVGGDTFTGGSGTNTLTLTTAGSANLGGVSKFGTIILAAGNSTVTVTDATLSGGTVTINDGASGNNSVSAASDTSASIGKTLTYSTGVGTDHFTGGFENDVVRVSAKAVGGDTLTGGSGTNTLALTSAGAVSLGGVSRFATINLATGTNTVTVTDTTLSGGSVAVHGGASGNNSISAAGDTAASTGKTLTDYLGTGTDTFTGGFEDDTIVTTGTALNASDSINGGSGTNTLMLSGGGTFNLGALAALTSIQTVNASEGQAAGGGVPSGVQTVVLRAGLDQTVNVASGTPNPLDPNPETITIRGAANNDVINLGGGTDTVVIGGAGETVNAGGGTALVSATAAFAGALVNGDSGTTNLKITTGGTATLNASDSNLTVNLTLATNLTLSKMSFIAAVGSTGNDTITALAQGQTLTGNGGKDTLNGFSGFGDVFSDTSAHLNTTTIGNFGGSDLIDLTDMNPNSIHPLTYNTTTETLTATDGTHTANIKFIGSYTLSDFQIGGSDGHTGSLIKFV